MPPRREDNPEGFSRSEKISPGAVPHRADAPEEPPRNHFRPGITFAPVAPDKVDPALRLILAEPGAAAAGTLRLASFRRLAQDESYDLTRMLTAWRQEELLHACLFVPVPGRTAFIFTAPPPPGLPDAGQAQAIAAENLRQLSAWAIKEGSQLLQVMTEPEDRARPEQCRAAGYRYLTDLIYLTRMMDKPVPAIPTPSDLTFLEYTPERHELFLNTILDTYRDSRDCPELENLRDPEDTLRGHMAAGIFEPALWKLLTRQGRPAGVILLSRLKNEDLLELTYMGLVPEARGQGWGRVLLAQGLHLAQKAGANCLSLALDSRNEPAFRLYTGFSFTFLIRRGVWIFSPRW